MPPAGSPAGTQPSHELPAGGTPTGALPADRPPTSEQSAGGLLTAGWPVAEPWWRRHARRLFGRWLPGRTTDPPRWRLAVLAAGGVLLGVAVAVGFTLSGTRDQPEIPPALPAASVSEVRSSNATAASTDGSIVISVVGRVATPGLITLSEGARVADALDAAGGPAPGVKLGSLNLARRLTDGEQIYVGVPTPPGAEPPAATPGAGQPGAAPVDLNSASLTALDTLPGVGPVTARRIIDWRTQHSRFASVDQLREVDGIGPTRFAKLKDLVVAG